MIKRNKSRIETTLYDFLCFCKTKIVSMVRNTRIFMDSSLASSNELMGALDRIVYYKNFMKSQGEEIAILCDTFEAKHIIEKGMNWKSIPIDTLIVCKDIDPPLKSKNYIDYTSDWEKQVQGIVIPRMFFNDDHTLYAFYSDIKMRGDKVAIFDQVSSYGTTYKLEAPKPYKYRELLYTLKKQSVIPSYYSNSFYIDYLLNLISRRSSVKVMDICAGQGCIGFSLFRESNNVDFVLSVEINENQIEGMNSTIAVNNLDHAKVQTCLSDGLTNVPQDMKFDLITGNPPHQNRPGTEMLEIQSADEYWNFHKRFFKSADQFLTDDGVICFIENRRPGYFNKNLFKEMVERLSPNLKLYESIWIPGTGWYLILICKNRRI